MIDVESLPEDIKKEVLDYAEFLIQKYHPQENEKQKNKFSFDWEGGLKDLKDEYSSVELQHKALGWR